MKRDIDDEIRDFVAASVVIGESLKTIRNKRLFREHGTFEDYCRERWGFSSEDAAAYIRGYDMFRDMTAPKNEATVQRSLSF